MHLFLSYQVLLLTCTAPGSHEGQFDHVTFPFKCCTKGCFRDDIYNICDHSVIIGADAVIPYDVDAEPLYVPTGTSDPVWVTGKVATSAKKEPSVVVAAAAEPSSASDTDDDEINLAQKAPVSKKRKSAK